MVTSFYFSGILDPARYVFELQDFDGIVYSRNITLGVNPAREQALNQTVVRFGAMNPTAEGFVISITDLQTGQTNAIDFTFDDDAIAPGRHIASPINIDAGLSDITVNIDHGTLSAAASSFNFSISYANPNVSIVFGDSPAANPVAIRHMGATVPAMGNLQISHFPQDNVTLASMDFNPLRSLTGRVDVIFSQMYKRYALNTVIPTTGMFTAGDDRAQTIELADHTITIHGIDHRGNIFAMPLFGVPRALPGETADRVATTIEVNLLGTNNLGQQLRIPGTVRYDARGTDVVFDASENPAFLDIPRDNLFLEFESISLRLPEFTASIYLDDLGFEPSYRTDVVRAAIESAFVPMGTAGIEEYDVQVRQVHIDGNTAYARVIERTAFMLDGNLHEVVQHHRVVANIAGGNASIISSVLESTEQRP